LAGFDADDAGVKIGRTLRAERISRNPVTGGADAIQKPRRLGARDCVYHGSVRFVYDVPLPRGQTEEKTP
jgi:hypothetical protein